MKQFKWACYIFFDSKGRRLSVFGNPTETGTEVTVLACSRKDIFSKKKAKELYREGKGVVYQLDTTDFNSFFDNALEKYYLIIDSDIEIKESEGKIVNVKKHRNFGKLRGKSEILTISVLTNLGNSYLCA